MKYVMHCDEVELVHVTTEDRLGSILETGIRPSAFGDMAVGEDDGAGVYAVRNDARLIQKFPAIVRPINPYFERRESVMALSFFCFMNTLKGEQHYEQSLFRLTCG